MNPMNSLRWIHLICFSTFVCKIEQLIVSIVLFFFWKKIYCDYSLKVLKHFNEISKFVNRIKISSMSLHPLSDENAKDLKSFYNQLKKSYSLFFCPYNLKPSFEFEEFLFLIFSLFEMV